MHLGKVKNYIILMLAVSNVILAALLAWKYYTAFIAARDAREELLALLNGRGITVEELPDDDLKAPQYLLERDADAERRAVEALLGVCERQDMGGGIYRYQSKDGTAQLRSGGRFEISLENGGIYTEPLSDVCVGLMSGMGFTDYTESCVESELDSGGRQLVFGQQNSGTAIFNARAVFVFSSEGKLESVSGLWALSTPKAVAGEPCKNAGTVLLLLSKNLDTPIEISGISLGFRLRTLTPGVSVLSPEWRVEYGEDGGYYLDAFSGGEVSPEE